MRSPRHAALMHPRTWSTRSLGSGRTRRATAAAMSGAMVVAALVASGTVQGYSPKRAIAATISAPTVSVVVSAPQSRRQSRLVSGKVSTKGPVLLVAYLASDSGRSGATFSSVSGCAVKWARVVRANGMAGPVEIWSAPAPAALSGCQVTAGRSFGSYLGLITIVGYANAGGIGARAAASAASGSPRVQLTATQPQSLVAAVGNDWDHAVARTPVTGQSLVAEYLAPVGDTYWVQRSDTAVTAPGPVIVADTAPTRDRFNLAAVEILPQPNSAVLATSQSAPGAPTSSPSPTSKATSSPSAVQTVVVSPTPVAASTATAGPTVAPSPTASTTATLTPTPTVSATSSPAATAPTAPVTGGFPDASSTGPAAAGYTLTAYSGSRSISTAGTVISGKKIVGDLDIYAANVTIKGCDITGTVTIHGVGGTQVLDSAIHGASATDTTQGDGIHTAGAVSTLTVKRTNIYWTYNDYLELSTGAFDIEDNYLHDAVRPAGNPPHFDGISVWDGPSSGTKIIHNTILIGFDQSTTGILGFAHDNGSANQLYANVTISNNLLGGTGYILYPPGPVSQNVTFTNNQVTTRYFPNGGSYGVVYKPQQPSWGTNGNTWSGNTWADGPKAGTTISSTN